MESGEYFVSLVASTGADRKAITVLILGQGRRKCGPLPGV